MKNSSYRLAALLLVGSSVGAQVDVPLEYWSNATWPGGLLIGDTNGVSWGDYNGDGYVDIFSLESGNLWENVGGTDWVLAANLLGLMPVATERYGTAIGDYNNDGLPDFAAEPRDLPGDSCFRLLKNLGGGPVFIDVAGDPVIVGGQACNANSETACWADVDNDRNIDLFLPIYPPTPCGVLFGPGNAFYHNLGPIGPGGEYVLSEKAFSVGLDNPPGCRPEGAFMLDVDHDGDIDAYTGGALFRNISTTGAPMFDVVTQSAGIQFSDLRDEGLAFFDIDRDGDFDLIVTYIDFLTGVRIFEAKGDGTYELLPASVVEDNLIGIKLGMSYADWDNDGDIDLTTRHTYRKNMYAQTGSATFEVATHAIPGGMAKGTTTAWADWDKDGDVDAAVNTWKDEGHLYDNTTYDATTPASDRRYVRVRPVNDSATVPMGLETEFGAVVEVKVFGDLPGISRRQFPSSAGGYLNQHEYTQHFALPDDPAPANPAIDLLFDVSVDFPGTTDAGLVRVDRHTNPVLGGIQLAALVDREIHVFRSGKVILDGCTFEPAVQGPTVLTTVNGGLETPTPSVALAPPAPVAGTDRYEGLEFDTLAATGPLRITEVIVEGQIAPAVTCGSLTGNVFLWDVTTPGSPQLVYALDETTRTTNDRSYLRTNVIVEPGRVYRFVANTTEIRPSAIQVTGGPIQVSGGLNFDDLTPCTGANLEAEALNPGFISMSFRYEDAGSAVVDLGHGLGGVLGIPQLTASGDLRPNTPIDIDITNAAASAPVVMFVSLGLDCLPVLGGTLVPGSPIVLTGFGTNASGDMSLTAMWPSVANAESATTLYFQAGILDLSAPQMLAFTNAIAAVTQP